MSTLSTVQRDRLVRVLGMLGSDHDGERASAGLHATRILKDAGQTWESLLSPMQQRHYPEAMPGGWLSKVAYLIQRRDEISSWEFDFLLNIARRPSLSFKQSRVLNDIFDKVVL